MSFDQKMSKRQKHIIDDATLAALKREFQSRCKGEHLPCAVAFEIAKQLSVNPIEVGNAADLLAYRLVKCQLGLFGYQPQKKKVSPQRSDRQDLLNAIEEALVGGKLPCQRAWQIAAQFGVSKMTVSNICEYLKIKIKPCQLGAF